MSSSLFARGAGVALLCSLSAGGCMVFDAKKQMEQIDASCLFSGSVSAARAESHPIVVILFRRTDGEGVGGRPWQVVDHFVMERPGKWEFLVPKAGGAYAAAAFQDINDDLVYQPGEPYGRVAADKPISCAPGGRYTDLAIAIPAKVSDPFPHALDISALQARSADAQVGMTLGQRTAVGEIVAINDPRFKMAVAEDSLWRPLDFVMNSKPGVYFLEPYDRRKVPVLFVHGINGSPANFTYLIEHLDRSRFQPWVYYYPSGVHLAAVADLLNQTMAKLEARYDFSRFAVVAHSMGGLVSRGFLLRNARTARAQRIPLYVTLSTPWEGHKAAELGIKYSPAVVRVWEDMVPGSAYQKSLFASLLPRGMAHHLVFTFKGSASGESADGVVTVASQLYPQAQHEAARLYGFNDTHDGVLANKEASALLNDLLARSY
jgi:pimeloyl-ACP methyl ester carboxylesterase